MVKLLITGKMGSGKGFAAARIANRYQATRWTRTELMKRLAHSIVDQTDNPEEILARIFPDPEERRQVFKDLLIYASNYQPEMGKPRTLYQQVTQICQDHDPLCFEIELADRIKMSEGNFSLIDDVRSRPAFEYFKDLGYKSLRINAEEEIRRQRMLKRDGYLPSDASFYHYSETDLDNVEHDFSLENNSEDIDVFYSDLDKICETLIQADLNNTENS